MQRHTCKVMLIVSIIFFICVVKVVLLSVSPLNKSFKVGLLIPVNLAKYTLVIH